MLVGAGVSATAVAGPLQRDQVPANAKWVLHLDFDAFKNSRLGNFLLKEVAEKELAKAKTELKLNVDFGFDKIRSITAYGGDFDRAEASGVMLIQTQPKTQGIIEALFQLSKSVQDTNGPVRKLVEGSRVLYVVHNDVFIEPLGTDLLLVGKSRKHIDQAGDVLAHRSPGLTAGGSFSGFAAVPNSFFFLAIAEGFNQNAPVPPQARILQMTEGGRLVLGERADKLFVNVALKAKNPDVTRQIQNVIQGMVALVALSQSANKDLLQLTQSLQVTSEDRLVSVGFEYPIGEAIKKVREKSQEGREKSAELKAEETEK